MGPLHAFCSVNLISNKIATSNAPNTKRKRRLSNTERDLKDEDDQANKKKARGESSTPSVVDGEDASLVPVPQVDTAEVKEVTQGVDEVHLDGNDAKAVSEGAPAPESVPLPEESADELEEPPTDEPIFIDAEVTIKEDTGAEIAVEEATSTVIDDASDVASSSAEDNEPELTQAVESKEVVSSSVKSREVPTAVTETTV